VPEFEPWFTAAHGLLRPPLAAWFNWHFEGLENVPREGPLLVAGNHISYFDPLADAYLLIKAGRKARFLAKSELFDTPLRPMLNGSKQIPVTRGSGSVAPLDSALKALHDGEAVVVYPEATVTKDEEFLPMRGKVGISRLALDAQVPVLPLAVWGSQHVWQRGGTRDLRFGRPIWVRAGSPMDLSEFEETKDEIVTLRKVTELIMDELRRMVLEMRAAYPKKWA
jgi:1-acyl-sn-glycerol-3-phosphate acyltransferase